MYAIGARNTIFADVCNFLKKNNRLSPTENDNGKVLHAVVTVKPTQFNAIIVPHNIAYRQWPNRISH